MTAYDAQLARVTSNFSLISFLGAGRGEDAVDWSDIPFRSCDNQATSENRVTSTTVWEAA